MYIIHEGEILIKEKYGSTHVERFYVKPPDQANVVVLDDSRSIDLIEWLTKIFLPQGYPDSVSKDYLSYQIWDTAQAFCSTITGTLATQEVLRGVGVGSTHATPLAATITWVVKDGCGHLSRILFAYSHGTCLDAYSKKWRIYADTLNDAAMCIEIALPLFKNYTILALCVSTAMKSVVGVAGGATRLAMTQHHAVRGNLADVSAKDAAQETAVNLIASIAAILVITLFGTSITLFIIMMVLHIVFNYLAVRAVCLRTLNETRFLQVVDSYLKYEVISAPCEVNRTEPIVFYQLGANLLDYRVTGFQIKLGYSVKKIIKNNAKAVHLNTIKDIYAARSYILYPNIHHREMYVLLKDNAIVDDYLCAYFHAVLLSVITCAINDLPLSMYCQSDDPRPFVEVCQAIQAADWSRTVTDKTSFSNFAYEPSYDLMKYVDEIAQKEWRRIASGLQQTGWDLSKHLLMVDEWRVYSHRVPANPITDQINLGSFIQSSTKFLTLDHSFVDELRSEENSHHDDGQDTFTIEPETSISKMNESVHTILQDKEGFKEKINVAEVKLKNE